MIDVAAAFPDAMYHVSTLVFASVWQGAILAGISAVLLPRVRTFRASHRVVLWWLLLPATVVLPAFFVETPASAAPQLQRASVLAEPLPDIVPRSPTATTNALPPLVTAERWFLQVPANVMFGIGVVWLAGTMLLFARIAAGLRTIARVKRAAVRAPAHVTELMRAIGASDIPVLVSEAVNAPAAVGYFRPAILLPGSAVGSLRVHSLRHVLLHETAHLKRYDHWSALILQIVRAIAWIAPSVHILARRIELDRELASDEHALARLRYGRNDGAHRYAESLLEVSALVVATRRTGTRLLALSASSQLAQRVDALLSTSYRSARHPLRASALGAATLGFITLLSAFAPLLSLRGVNGPIASTSPVSTVTGKGAALATSHARDSVRTRTTTGPHSVVPGTIHVPDAAATPTTNVPDTVASMIALLASEDPRTRANAAFRLSQLRSNAVDAVAALVEQLHDERPVSRDAGRTSSAWESSEDPLQTTPAEEASKALLYIGKAAYPGVRGAAARTDRAMVRLAHVTRLLANFD